MDILLASLSELFVPLRFAMLIAGVLLGLIIGVIPGIGGIFGLTLLVPVTYTLDPISAFTLLLGMSSVTTTSDTIPAVLLGVPGTVGSAATAIDGHEMAKQGKAAEALGAAYSASLIGGIFGVIVLTISLPIMRSVVLLFNYGDLLAITIFGLTLVALLSGGNQLRALFVALLGLLTSFVGLDPYESHERWTFDQVYLWDGIPTSILFLGLFGLSELANLGKRGRIQNTAVAPTRRDMWKGMKETLFHMPLVLRCSAFGSLLGAIPGVGVTVIEWIAYGEAARHPGKGPEVGKGNVRAVIAPESANNSKEGGALLPTLAFGIPGSATMAILLGAFAIHGLVPGPDMLTTDAPLLITMILTIALANIFGTVICLCMTPRLARIALVPMEIIVPLALTFVVLGAFHVNKDPRDIVMLLVFGAIGITLKRLGWSRPAFALGFVLGPNLERFFFLSYQISGWDWLTQPFVMVILAIPLAAAIRKLADWKRGRISAKSSEDNFAHVFLTLLFLLLFILSTLTAVKMPFAARIFPMLVCVPAIIIGITLLAQSAFAYYKKTYEVWVWPIISVEFKLVTATGLMGLLILIFGHLWAPPAFIILAAIYFRSYSLVSVCTYSTGAFIASYLIFDVLAEQSWPTPWIFQLKSILLNMSIFIPGWLPSGGVVWAL